MYKFDSYSLAYFLLEVSCAGVFTGYGTIAPATMSGRLVVIAYALLAIPLFMLALANIGQILANLFRITYATICCCGCCRRRRPDKKLQVLWL